MFANELVALPCKLTGRFYNCRASSCAMKFDENVEDYKTQHRAHRLLNST